MVTHYRMQLLLSLTQFFGGHRDVSNVLTKTILVFFVSSLAMIWEHCKEKKKMILVGFQLVPSVGHCPLPLLLILAPSSLHASTSMENQLR